MQIFAIHPFSPPADTPEFRAEVRALILRHEAQWPLEARANSWFSFDPEFSRALGAAGLIGMMWPKKYGGHEHHPLERYVVLEELLPPGRRSACTGSRTARLDPCCFATARRRNAKNTYPGSAG